MWTPLDKKIKIDVVEPVGNEIFLYFSESETSHCIRLGPDKTYQPNQQLALAFSTDKMYFFDKKNGNRII
jgi:ABC-type sugar transport system ATPase subunit